MDFQISVWCEIKNIGALVCSSKIYNYFWITLCSFEKKKLYYYAVCQISWQIEMRDFALKIQQLPSLIIQHVVDLHKSI